jgi:lysophospholipase L1-like esterase
VDRPGRAERGLGGQPPSGAARALWIGVGALALVVHVPLGPAIGFALGVPWALVMLLLSSRRTGVRTVAALREALAARSGLYGLVGLSLSVVGVMLGVAVGAGVLLALWLAAITAVVGLLRGPLAVREWLGIGALAALTTGFALTAAEAVLRIDAVAARLGTPAEIDRWWQRYDGLWERNVLGIRSTHETLRKPNGTFRVVVLGDSFTWGDKIASSDSVWPAQLEARLREKAPEQAIEVVNLGEKGFTTVNEAEMLRRLGWQFAPDVVVVQFYLNDILPGGPDFERGYSGWIFPRAWVLPSRYRGGLAGRSALLYQVESVLTGLRHGDRTRQAATWTEVYQRRGPEWQALDGALQEMGAAASRAGVPIVMVLFPDFIPGMAEMEELPFQAIHDQVTLAAQAAGFTVLDLTPHFMQEEPEMRRWWVTPYDAHPNARAAALAARVLAEHLIAEIPASERRDP